IACSSNTTKGRSVHKIQIATRGLRKCRMIRQVKRLGTKLEAFVFTNGKRLEEREVETPEGRPGNLGVADAERRKIGLAHRRHHRGIREGSSIVVMVHVVRTAVR